MDTRNAEICGFLYVKLVGQRYIARKVRKKVLVSSKVWKRLWCCIKKLGSGPSAIIYRIHSKTKQFAFGILQGKDRKLLLSLSTDSETETQRWMKNIRYLLNPKKDCIKKSYNVSIVDNAHSKAAGLIGLYGNLTATETGIFIQSPHIDKIIKSFKWKEFGQFHLMTAGRPEDVKRICVIHTTKEFCCGTGELYLFCLDADKLLQDLVTQGRGPKYRQKSLNFNKIYEVSKQHNELVGSFSQGSNSWSILDIKTDCEAIENVYQSISASLTNNVLDFYNYEKFDISTASGIYEEIVDNVYSTKLKANSLNIYEDIDQILYNLQIKPPPLPLRQRQRPECTEKVRLDTKEYFDAEICDLEENLQSTDVCKQEIIFIENSNYVPMSPQLRNLNLFKSDAIENAKQDDYVTMR
ncbi:uncharacterized protein LOC105185810 isoform X2 [Harpegnathos saltator]|uniref:uncharacterized protein LOC105185810 isoform X2 n=1 Tax=Harpegnathos saltator TaxID=610380 RepID=UPI000DBECFE6|nr:uncharacterized protein LOC105185810 isoform X2 [Harpegnathos saltator]